jgi:hypothetical protein
LSLIRAKEVEVDDLMSVFLYALKAPEVKIIMYILDVASGKPNTKDESVRKITTPAITVEFACSIPSSVRVLFFISLLAFTLSPTNFDFQLFWITVISY